MTRPFSVHRLPTSPPSLTANNNKGIFLSCAFLLLPPLPPPPPPPSQCERNPCPMDSRPCHLAPKTVSFHYLSLPSNLKTPATLFRMATASAPGRAGPDSLRFGIVSGNARGTFVMQRSDRQTGELLLVQTLRGPLDVTVDVDMSEYSERTFQAKHVAKVHVLVSPHNF
ncbi:hypothetical protein NHX12_022291 [Muraenolepis orangiensis]|uniref:Fibulin C-terminal Ig-like domain-containing protein n=1 Tax=Muraenolepis orangiensis TaxID=630683 RepID=A0A9Q0IR53_9TELE|nr:hypothetical protein NHX12_022291 [Muraenolepis orangiensis]